MGLSKKFELNPLDVLAALLSVDGEGSLLDSDMLDGKHAIEFAPVEHINDSVVHVTAEDKTDWNAKADVSNEITATLTAAGWTGSITPYTQTLTISGMTATKKGYLGVAQGLSKVIRDAAANAIISIYSQGTNTITLVADGIKPTVDIPIVFNLIS